MHLKDNQYVSCGAWVMIKLRFVETCSGSPEQYAVFTSDGTRVGYLRLRWGRFTVTCPDTYGEVVYTHVFNDGWLGQFTSDKQRKKYLRKAEKAIKKWVKNHDSFKGQPVC